MSVKLSPLVKKIFRDVGIVLLAFVVSWVLVYDISSLSYFAPLEKASDFSPTDFYQIVSDNRAVRTLNDDVVIVSVDGLSREDITDVLEIIAECSPAAVGVDIIFGYPQPDDDRLVCVLSELPNVVVPDTSAYIYSSCQGLKQGSVYFEAASYRSTVRDCRAEGTFAGELASLYRPGLQMPETMKIEYAGIEFEVIQAGELLSCPEIIEGKIALVGAVNDISDFHPTPISDSMSGVMIHAASIATMLSTDRISEFPAWADWLLAIILCYIFIATTRWFKKPQWGDCVMRIIQFLFLIFIIMLGSVLYIKYRVNLNFTRPLLMIAAGMLAVDLWNGTSGLVLIYMKAKNVFIKYYRSIRRRFAQETDVV